MRKKLMAGPYLLWMLVFTIVPLLFVFYYGFTSSDGTFTFSNITAIFEKIHIQALGLSLLLAVITTVVCLLFAYPLALILSKSAAKNAWRGFMPANSKKAASRRCVWVAAVRAALPISAR